MRSSCGSSEASAAPLAALAAAFCRPLAAVLPSGHPCCSLLHDASSADASSAGLRLDCLATAASMSLLSLSLFPFLSFSARAALPSISSRGKMSGHARSFAQAVLRRTVGADTEIECLGTEDAASVRTKESSGSHSSFPSFLSSLSFILSPPRHILMQLHTIQRCGADCGDNCSD